jgi:hypothetical protein
VICPDCERDVTDVPGYCVYCGYPFTKERYGYDVIVTADHNGDYNIRNAEYGISAAHRVEARELIKRAKAAYPSFDPHGYPQSEREFPEQIPYMILEAAPKMAGEIIAKKMGALDYTVTLELYDDIDAAKNANLPGGATERGTR